MFNYKTKESVQSCNFPLVGFIPKKLEVYKTNRKTRSPLVCYYVFLGNAKHYKELWIDDGDEAIKDYVQRVQKYYDKKAKEKQEKILRRKIESQQAFEFCKVGQIYVLCRSWESTYIDFYKITEIKSSKVTFSLLERELVNNNAGRNDYFMPLDTLSDAEQYNKTFIKSKGSLYLDSKHEMMSYQRGAHLYKWSGREEYATNSYWS